MPEENLFWIWYFKSRWHHIKHLILITATCSNKVKKIQSKCSPETFSVLKKYLLQFGSIACCIHFHYLIFYVYEFSFTWHQTKQRQNLIFAFWKLTIMTGNYVHFLILKNTKKFTNFWWLNLGTESVQRRGIFG